MNKNEAGERSSHEASEETASAQKRRAAPLSVRERSLAATAVIAVVVAAVSLVLYFGSLVPADAAAKIDDQYLSEAEVAAWIEQYRLGNGLDDDATFAQTLLNEGENVSTFRQGVVNQIALDMLVEQRASELGISPSDEAIADQLAQAKERFSLGDDNVWAETLSSYNLTEEKLLEQYRSNLAQAAVLEAEVSRRDATDAELLSYLQTNLAGTTQKHAYRIVFIGDDRSQRAQECLAKLDELAESGAVSVEQFSELAASYSDEQGASESGGSYAWSGASMIGEVKDLLADLEVGEHTVAETVEADDALEIIFCDAVYEFPKAAALATVPDDVPDELLDEVREAASEVAWESDCESYLASLLVRAKITYFPVPDDAAYNVDMSLAQAA